MRIVLIGGAQRSGTTLVQTLIANSLPNAPLLPEAHILCDLLRVWKSAKANWSKTSRFYSSEEEAIRFFRATAALHIKDITVRYLGVEHLVLKNPSFNEVLPEIAEIIPAATVLICIRDPRDIVASFLRIGKRDAERQRITRYSRREVGFICRKINAAYQPLLEERSLSGRAIVRYEDVVADPVSALERLARETGLPLKPDRAHSLVWLEDEYRHKETWRTDLEGGPPVQDSIGSYRDLLSRDEQVEVYRSCRPLLDRFLYVTEKDESPAPSIYQRLRELLHRSHGKVEV